ncbi:hypothetical protein H7F37_15355 [Winogradskyella sp. PAMC22761]|nr:hypothetical protein H7F37_15355 [Winogradskyella sp. PAMC22761]
MSKNDAFILTLAYPETVVTHAKEWYSKFLRFLFVGSKKHVRAGHAALVLVNKGTGILEYYDFGRYITAFSYGRVRGKETDFELNVPLKAEIENDTIINLDAVLEFFATQPRFTHGEGHLYASICNVVNYNSAKTYIGEMQSKGFVRYAAFINDASNCARFVTDTLIESVTNLDIKKQLLKSKKFTPSTIGNVVIADTENRVYKVSESGEFVDFKSTVRKENIRLFIDRLKGYNSSLVGTIHPKHNTIKSNNAQWLNGIGSGAWFEIYDLKSNIEYRFRRISSYGTVDCDGIYKIDKEGFDINSEYQFLHNSNCLCFYIEQDSMQFQFDFIKNNTTFN